MTKNDAIKAAEAVTGSHVRAAEAVNILIALGLLKVDQPPQPKGE